MRYVLACLLATVLCAPLEAQQVITIQPAQVSGILAATTTRNTVVLPRGGYSSATVLLNITASGTATGTLQIWIEDSQDGGTTWDDLIATSSFALGAAAVVQRYFISGFALPSIITTATAANISQGSVQAVETLTAPAARQGPFGDRWRVREKITGPSGSPVGATYTITAVFR